MKYKLLIIALFMAQMVFAQPDKHVRVFGTKCSIVPPEGFIPATQFYGFLDPKTGASIKIEEYPIPYQAYADDFESIIASIRGLILIDKEEIDFNLSKALLTKVRLDLFDTTIFSLSLVFGNDDETVYVKGNYSESVPKIEENLRKALLTTLYDSRINDNPTEAASFTVDLTGTDFKCVKFESGGLLFTTDGKIKTEGPRIRIDKSFQKIKPENLKQFAIDRLNNFAGEEHIIFKEIKAITIDHLEGYEILAVRPSSGTEFVSVYQLVLLTESSGYYLFDGQCDKDVEKFTEMFRKIAVTFKRK